MVGCALVLMVSLVLNFISKLNVATLSKNTRVGIITDY